MATLSTKDFTYSKRDNTLTSELSSLPKDAIKVKNGVKTIVVRSHVTGIAQQFTEGSRTKDREGDLITITYFPTNPALRRAGLHMILLND